MKLYDPDKELPENGQYVLAHFPDRPWVDSGAKHNEHKWVVVRFVKGLSLAERKALPDGNDRKRYIHAEDEWGNNQRPYYWDTFGPGSFFGQEASCWCRLPPIPNAEPAP